MKIIMLFLLVLTILTGNDCADSGLEIVEVKLIEQQYQIQDNLVSLEALSLSNAIKKNTELEKENTLLFKKAFQANLKSNIVLRKISQKIKKSRKITQ